MDYIKQQDLLYQEKNDPWANLDETHPRFHITEQYFQIVLASIPGHCRSVVDIGCGNGKLVSMLSERGFSAIGVDTSETAIKTARETFTDQQFVVGDIRTWKPESPVDAVLSTGSYYHLDTEDRKRLVHHVYQYLNKGGIFVVVYGLNERLVGEPSWGYDLDIASELFSVFSPYQKIDYLINDSVVSEQSGWSIFVGRKL